MPLSQRGKKMSKDLTQGTHKRPPGSTLVAEGGGSGQQSVHSAPSFFFPPPIQVSVLAEGRTSCDDGIQCPVCLLLRAFLLLITKQPDALLPSVVLSLQRGVLGLRGMVMHNSIYSHPQPSTDAGCFTARQPLLLFLLLLLSDTSASIFLIAFLAHYVAASFTFFC